MDTCNDYHDTIQTSFSPPGLLLQPSSSQDFFSLLHVDVSQGLIFSSPGCLSWDEPDCQTTLSSAEPQHADEPIISATFKPFREKSGQSGNLPTLDLAAAAGSLCSARPQKF